MSLGDRVAVLSYHAYAEYDLASASAVVPLPPALAGRPFPGEPLGCALNILRRSGIEPGQTVAIVGIGFLGALLTRLAASTGARVIAISRRPFSLDVARTMGAAETISMDDHWRIIEQVKDLTARHVLRRRHRGRRQAVAARPRRRAHPRARSPHHRRLPPGRPAPGQHAALELARPRRHQRPRARPGGLHPRHSRRRGRRGHRPPRPRPALHPHLPADRLGEALDATRDRPDGFLKALVTFA